MQAPGLFFGIIVVGIIACVLLLVASFRMWGDERKGSKDAAAGPEAASTPPAAPAANPLSALLNAKPKDTAGAHEVLRVLRDRLTGRPIVEIGGKRYAQMSEVIEDNVRQGLFFILRDLQEFTGAVPPASPAPLPAPPPAQALAPSNGTPPAASAPSGDVPVNRPAGSLRPAEPTPISPLTMPSMNPFKQWRNYQKVSRSVAPEPPSIAEQIDVLLQDMLAGTPNAQRGIKVATTPSGGVAFRLDGQVYDAVDAVPDPAVRVIFRDAIAAWERRQ